MYRIKIIILVFVLQSVAAGQNSPYKIMDVKSSFIRPIKKEIPYHGKVYPAPHNYDYGSEYLITVKVLNPQNSIPIDSQLAILCFLPDLSFEKIIIIEDGIKENSKGYFYYSFPIHVFKDGWIDFGITNRIDLPLKEEIEFYKYLRRDEKIYLYERYN